MKILLFVLTFLFSSQIASAQKLRKAKENISQTTSSSSNYSNHNAEDSGSSEDNNSFGDAMLAEFGYLLVEGLMFATYGLLIETPMEADYDMSFSKAPYFGNNIGDYTNEGDDSKSFRIDASGAFLTDNANIIGATMNLKIRPHVRFNFEMEHTGLYERLPFGETDQLAMTSFVINYQRLRLKPLTLSWGLGATHVGSGVDKFGFTMAAAAEVYIKRPVSLYTNIKQTFVNETSISNFNVGLKYFIKSFYLGAGYHSINFGGSHVPMLGIHTGIYF